MRRRMLNQREQRLLAGLRLLDAISQSTYPRVFTEPVEVEQLLGLHAAGLVKATFDPLVHERSGVNRIPRVVVSGVTQEGWATLAQMQRRFPGSLSRATPRRSSARPTKAGAGSTVSRPGNA